MSEPRLIQPSDEEFPPGLEVADPVVEHLWVIGAPLSDCVPAVAVVGARGATGYGLEVAHSLAADLASLGVCVVSGMARGIDSAAHEGALSAGGRTIAVLGTGVDVPYPVVNRPLYTAIRGSGAIVSELPRGAGPRKEHFPARNRIIAGLSLGVVLVQARSEKSGAMITVSRALDYGREVFAVPGDVRSELSTGPHELLRHGAALCVGAADVVGVLQDQFARASPRFGGPAAMLTAALKDRSGRIEVVAVRAGIDLPAALRAAGRLELAGVIVREAGGVLKLARDEAP